MASIIGLDMDAAESLHDLPLTQNLLRFYKDRLHLLQEDTESELLERLSVLRGFLLEHHDATSRLETQLHELQHENTSISHEVEDTIKQRLEIINIMKENQALKEKLNVLQQSSSSNDSESTADSQSTAVDLDVTGPHIDAISQHYEDLIAQLMQKFHNVQAARESERSMSNTNIDFLNDRCKKLETVVSDSIQDIIQANSQRATLEERLKETEEELNVSVTEMQSQLDVFEQHMTTMNSMRVNALPTHIEEPDGFNWEDTMLPDTEHFSPHSKGLPILKEEENTEMEIEAKAPSKFVNAESQTDSWPKVRDGSSSPTDAGVQTAELETIVVLKRYERSLRQAAQEREEAFLQALQDSAVRESLVLSRCEQLQKTIDKLESQARSKEEHTIRRTSELEHQFYLQQTNAKREQQNILENTNHLISDLNFRIEEMKSTNTLAQDELVAAQSRIMKQAKAYDSFLRHRQEDEADLSTLKQNIIKLERIALQYAPIEDAGGLLNAIDDIKKSHMATQTKHKKRRKKEQLLQAQ